MASQEPLKGPTEPANRFNWLFQPNVPSYKANIRHVIGIAEKVIDKGQKKDLQCYVMAAPRSSVFHLLSLFPYVSAVQKRAGARK